MQELKNNEVQPKFSGYYKKACLWVDSFTILLCMQCNVCTVCTTVKWQNE